MITLGTILVIPLIIISVILLLPFRLFRRFDERVSRRDIPSKDFLRSPDSGVVHFESVLQDSENTHGQDSSHGRKVASAEAVH